MTLLDRPPMVVRWETGFDPELLRALGKLTVITAEIEQQFHLLYWKHAALTDQHGPIVTDNLTPKRLSEDILKFTGMDPAKAHIHTDLKILLKEFEALNTERNRCLHWIWSIVGVAAPEIVTLSTNAPQKVPLTKFSGQSTRSRAMNLPSTAWRMCRSFATTAPGF